MTLIMSEAQKKDAKIKTINHPTLLSVRVELVRAHQNIGNLLTTVDADTADNLVACRTYINQAMKELKKIDAR